MANLFSQPRTMEQICKEMTTKDLVDWHRMFTFSTEWLKKFIPEVEENRKNKTLLSYPKFNISQAKRQVVNNEKLLLVMREELAKRGETLP